MNLLSQSMRNVMLAMMQTEKMYVAAKDKSDQVNPDAPVVVQLGDFGYEVIGVGGDPDVEGFVLSLKEEPVCEWRDGECVRL